MNVLWPLNERLLWSVTQRKIAPNLGEGVTVDGVIRHLCEVELAAKKKAGSLHNRAHCSPAVQAALLKVALWQATTPQG